MAKADNELPKVINAYKEVGETPLEVVNMLKESREELGSLPITYAGRLDPMAEGVLLLLVGDEVHQKDKYLELDKEYEFKILFGFSTDTYDLLGRVDDTSDKKLNIEEFKKVLGKFTAKQEQKYPPYSSKTVEGKPLFQWTRESRLHEIEIPSHEIEIKKMDLEEMEEISKVDLKKYLQVQLSKVKGDFRVKDTLELWNAYINNSQTESFELASVKIKCTSGTYVRTLVHDIGEELKIPATTFSIRRTAVGEYSI